MRKRKIEKESVIWLVMATLLVNFFLTQGVFIGFDLKDFLLKFTVLSCRHRLGAQLVVQRCSCFVGLIQLLVD